MIFQIHQEPVLWQPIIYSIVEGFQVDKAASTKALVASIVHSLHVSDVSSDDIASSVVEVVFPVVVSLDSMFEVIVLVVDSLHIVDVGILCA